MYIYIYIFTHVFELAICWYGNTGYHDNNDNNINDDNDNNDKQDSSKRAFVMQLAMRVIDGANASLVNDEEAARHHILCYNYITY